MKRVIIILGAPGSGKGTQASLLADKLRFYYFETSRILEQVFENVEKTTSFVIDGQTYFIAKEKQMWQSGILNSPAFVAHLVNQKIKELAAQNYSIVFAGSPRTLFEAEKVLPVIKELYGSNQVKVFLLDISLEDSIFRNSNRRLCELFRHPILWNRETKGLTFCPLDGSPLIKRALDKPQIIKVRWQEYQERTLPVIDYLANQGILIHKIDGKPPVAEIFQNILKILND